jgi:hypothetical protein
VRAVAVIAFRGLLGAELGYLAVERVEVRLGHVKVTFAALIEDLLSKVSHVDTPDRVGLMAVVANRFEGKTVDVESVMGFSLWAVWQLTHVAVTMSPLSSKPLPWMLIV